MANVTQLSDPVAITADSAQALGDSAQDVRFGVGGLAQPNAGSTWGWTAGVLPGASSTGAIADLLLNPNSPTGMTSVLNPGNYAIPRIGQGVYLGAVSSGVTVTHPPSNPSNPRLDYVVLRVRDPGVDPPTVTASAQLVVLSGNPSATPIAPTAQLTDGDMVLAGVTVRAATTSILSSDIADLRQFVTSRGGIYPKSAADSRTGSYQGQYRDNQATEALERWSGGAWQAVATPAAWTQFTPGLWSSAGPVYLGSGPGTIALGRYQITGKMMSLRYMYYGIEPMNMGYGPIYTTLPPGIISAPIGETSIMCRLNTGPLNQTIFFGFCSLQADSTTLVPWFPLSTATSQMGPYQAATTAGTPSTGIPLISGGYPDPGVLLIQGSIEIG